MSTKNNKIAIVGAGASGLICAIFCAKAGLRVDIYEQNSKPAKKILVSGNGRCNISNIDATSNNYFTNNSVFIKEVLKQFNFEQFTKFTNSIGLLLDIKDDGRVYPLSNEAKSVVKIFEDYAKNLNVNFHLNEKIEDIDKLTKEYNSVVVATGSEAASHLGGNSDGYNFAQKYNHTIVPTYPSLVQLHLNSQYAKKMSGAKIDAEVTLFINNKKETVSKGDILFTNYGVSGFAILDISQLASVTLLNYEAVDISINLLPSFNAQKLSTHILNISQNIPHFTILDILVGLIPIKIAQNLLEYLKIEQDISSQNIHTKLTKKIANRVLNWRFEVTQTHGFRHAEVSGGGVDTTEIDSKTMQSLKQKNLYFIGEVLDVVGERGGYNFTFAWASGYICAKHLSKKWN
ncbi:MAG: NAD(P)/FAD-dependent oxidoreductase [Campylobacterota bacterium]|nr:NAD(P)/FAD-dependent oxidoreductase [Campylobacterota bacterium]